MGDWAGLRLRHRAPASLPTVTRGKLKPRFYGPHRVIECINNVAVRLQLPPRSRLHDVFHIGLLKKFVGAPPEVPPPLPTIHHGAAVPEPERAVRARLACGVRQVLIQWKGEPASSATWEDIDAFIEQHLTFQLEDELLLQGGEMSCGACSIAAAGPGPQQLRRAARPDSAVRFPSLLRKDYLFGCNHVDQSSSNKTPSKPPSLL